MLDLIEKAMERKCFPFAPTEPGGKFPSSGKIGRSLSPQRNLSRNQVKREMPEAQDRRDQPLQEVDDKHSPGQYPGQLPPTQVGMQGYRMLSSPPMPL